MPKPKVAVIYNQIKGGTTVKYLTTCLEKVGCEVVYVDYEAMTEAMSENKFNQLYSSAKGRDIIFAHAKTKANEILDNVDCLALPGNSLMIDPILFGNKRTGHEYSTRRTMAELALIHVAMQRGMPIYGACGGHQVIAVYGGGHLRDLTIDEKRHHNVGRYDDIFIKEKSILSTFMSSKNNRVYGAHRQVVSKVGPNLKVVANGSDGVVIEACESVEGSPILTTQFHPEVTYHESFMQRDAGNEEKNQRVANSKKIFTYMHDVAQTYQNKKELIASFKLFSKNKDLNQNAAEVNPPIVYKDKKSLGFSTFILKCWTVFIEWIVSLFKVSSPEQSMMNTPSKGFVS